MTSQVEQMPWLFTGALGCIGYRWVNITLKRYSLDHPAVDVPEQDHPGTLPKPDLLQKKLQ